MYSTNRRLWSNFLSVILVLALTPASVFSSAPPKKQAAPQVAPQVEALTLYRVWVTARLPADVARLSQLGLTLYAQAGNQFLTFATKDQLATLARRGFQPSSIVEVKTLVDLAEASLLDGLDTTYAVLNLASPDAETEFALDQRYCPCAPPT